MARVAVEALLTNTRQPKPGFQIPPCFPSHDLSPAASCQEDWGDVGSSRWCACCTHCGRERGAVGLKACVQAGYCSVECMVGDWCASTTTAQRRKRQVKELTADTVLLPLPDVLYIPHSSICVECRETFGIVGRDVWCDCCAADCGGHLEDVSVWWFGR